MGHDEDLASAEARHRLIEFANQLALKNPDLHLLRRNTTDNQYSDVIECLEHLLLQSDERRKLILPNLSAFSNQSLGVFSDYSGEGAGRYFVYSILICGFNMHAPFGLRMAQIREDHNLGAKEIAYKDFNMGQLRRALPHFLTATDGLPGFLCTIAVDKRISTVFGANDKETPARLVEIIEQAGLGRRKPRTAEKLLRVVHLTAYLTALLATNGQKVFWMSDHDEICANPTQHALLLELFGRVLPIYTRPGCVFGTMGGALPFAERSIDMNDLLSIPDVVAGTLGDYLSKRDVEGPENICVKRGAEEVLLWLARDGIGLKKACFVMRKTADGMIERGSIEFSPVTQVPGVFVPIFDKATGPDLQGG
jgi:hypothetical protein